MKKALLIVILTAVVLMIGYGGWKVYSWFNEEPQETSKEEVANAEQQSNLEEQREMVQGSVTEADIAAFSEEGLNPFGHPGDATDLTDTIYQEYIHGMSHQKVEAEEKWGFYGIHPERINWLLESLEVVELEHEDVYREILEKWQQGDFSTADDDHNAIWTLQGGTVGKATGVLSAEEEQSYINSRNN
ncbi:DUF6241 domain-containing protein [Ornithinibacillus contaminans]|uniref:DUF6241 domain-containing protein n=1 Tax=Ornithinibacillus contaminans TaxID=694055 RepID=UPI00069DB49F|nr:DUF6241 domain-containing protein [Ornithinibacillus contaminans]